MEEETQNLTDVQHVEALISSQGWNIIKPKLDAKILDLQNISNIDTSSTDKMIIEVAARKMAVDILWNWLKRDVYGFVEQQQVSHERTVVDEHSSSTYLGRQ